MRIFQHSTLTIDSLGCQELTLSTKRAGKIQPSGSVVTISSHWFPIALDVPFTRCDNRDRGYALSRPLCMATVATGVAIHEIGACRVFDFSQFERMMVVTR